MKGINPGVAYMIDPASAIHIRFRLGGTTFPPTLFYKIFTHNPVCDIGAFAPRDYTVVKRVLDSKKRNASTGSLASSASFEADPDDKSRWYRREDNNGWRPISDKLIGDLDFDHENYTTPAVVRSAVSRETKREQQTNEVFHFSSIQRAKEKKANRKKRKVEWLKKMYRMNLMRGKQAHNIHCLNANSLTLNQRNQLWRTNRYMPSKEILQVERLQRRAKTTREGWKRDELRLTKS